MHFQSAGVLKLVDKPDLGSGAERDTSDPVRYITVIVPKENSGNTPSISAKFVSKTFSENGLKVQVKVGKKKKTLEYTL